MVLPTAALTPATQPRCCPHSDTGCCFLTCQSVRTTSPQLREHLQSSFCPAAVWGAGGHGTQCVNKTWSFLQLVSFPYKHNQLWLCWLPVLTSACPGEEAVTRRFVHGPFHCLPWDVCRPRGYKTFWWVLRGGIILRTTQLPRKPAPLPSCTARWTFHHESMKMKRCP